MNDHWDVPPQTGLGQIPAGSRHEDRLLDVEPATDTGSIPRGIEPYGEENKGDLPAVPDQGLMSHEGIDNKYGRRKGHFEDHGMMPASGSVEKGPTPDKRVCKPAEHSVTPFVMETGNTKKGPGKGPLQDGAKRPQSNPNTGD
ncbi:MAG: hypothetical protein C7B44_05695 [Sulfobacillus thermosulfidooxidans]|nr:MAG: hypothetical protein C7B44_05695 [Sulfobacillus thermosulfidooxidans]